MAGFTSFDELLTARSVNSYGQDLTWQKTVTWNPAAGIGRTLWAAAGVPAAGVYTGAANTAAQATSSTAGAVKFTNPTSPRNLFAHSLTGLSTSGTGTLFLWDRLLYYPGINHATVGATAQTNGVALPRYTTGHGVYAFLEVTTGLNAVAHTIALTYTGSVNGAGQTTGAQTITVSTTAEGLPHAFLFFPLAAGDRGIVSVQTVTVASGGAPTGTSCLVLARLLAALPIGTAGLASVQDLLRGPQIALPEINDNACLMWTFLGSTSGTTPTFGGTIYAAEN